MLNRFFYLFGLGPKTQEVVIYMRSGSKIRLDKVTNCTWKHLGDDITSFGMTQRDDARVHLQVTTLRLSQIEAIVVEK